MIAASSITFLNGFLWMAHCSRKFVYWWNGFLIIALTLIVQDLNLWKVDRSKVRAVLMMGVVATACLNLSVNVLTGIYGFVIGPRKQPQRAIIAAGSGIL